MSTLKTIVRGAYDLQKLRIQMGNRVVGNFKVKLGQEPSKTEEDISPEGKELLAVLRLSYARIADGMKAITAKHFKQDGVIDSFSEFVLLHSYFSIEKDERQAFDALEHVLRDHPIYVQFLRNVKGVGPAMAGVIISEINIHNARHPSSLWKYAGLDVGPDGRGRSRRKEHLVMREYTNREGELAERNGITFNPFLKTKLMGVLGPSFLRAKSPYAEIYYNTRSRLENHWQYANDTKGHRHNMALRKMVKQFLVDLYKEWRTLEGLPVSTPYAEEKLGLVHGEDRRVA